MTDEFDYIDNAAEAAETVVEISENYDGVSTDQVANALSDTVTTYAETEKAAWAKLAGNEYDRETYANRDEKRAAALETAKTVLDTVEKEQRDTAVANRDPASSEEIDELVEARMHLVADPAEKYGLEERVEEPAL